MHTIEFVIELIISAVAIIALSAVAFPSLADLPAPGGSKIELISRPSHD
jgi:hypothetical protein